MLVNCQGQSFANAIQTVSKAITGKKIGNSILECIKIEAIADTLILSATDGELSIERKIKAEIFKEGIVVLNYKLISEFVAKLEADNVNLKIEDNQLIISYGENSCSFACQNSDEFPKIDIVGKEDYFKIKGNVMIDMITRTLYAASVEDTRPVLKGCYLSVSDDRLVMVALDGYRMAVYGVTDYECHGTPDMIIPQRSLNEMIKIIDASDEAIEVYFNQDKIMIDLDHTVVISRLIKGKYIDYKAIIAKNFETVVTFRRDEIKNALNRVMVISKTTKSNVVDFEIRGKKMYLRSKGDVNGEIVENINIRNEGHDVEIAFNAKNISDVINNNNDETMRMFIRNGDSACVVKSFDNDDNLNLILPIKKRRA